MTLINRVVAANDWRADAWLLARLAPDEFSERSVQDRDNDGPDGSTPLPAPDTIRVILETTDSATAPAVEYEVIDVAAEQHRLTG